MLEFVWSGILAIIGAIVGALIAYYSQKRTQERAWKREYAVDIAVEVYGTLFSAIRSVVLPLEEKWYKQFSFDAWLDMQYDHRYFMVDEKFRNKLDIFLQRVKKYSDAIYELREKILKRVAKEETKRIFDIELLNIPKFEIKCQEGSEDKQISVKCTDCLITDTHPTKYVLKERPNVSDCVFNIRIHSLDGKPHLFDDENKVKEFWESCLKRMKEKETYKFIVEENDRLLEEAKDVKKEITKRIEEPWKI